MIIKGNSLDKPLKEIIEQNPDVSLKDLLTGLLTTNAEEIRGILTRTMVESAEKVLNEYDAPEKNLGTLIKETP